MMEGFKTYFETLEGLSTEELDRSAEKLVRAEKRNLALVIAHIAYLVALRPKPVFVPSIRKTPSLPALTSPPSVQTTSPEPAQLHTTILRPAPRVSPSILEPARPDLFNFRFAADRKFKEKFERLAEVLGVENPLLHMAEIMEQALDIALDKKDLKRKRARRLERSAKRRGETSRKKSRPDEVFAKSRYIPAEVRERVHERADSQCEYRGPDGTRCRSRTGLEIEHERPFALHRSDDERFLWLYCRSHNRLSAERVFGVAFIQQKIDTSRRKLTPNGRADSW